jgi:16S rRNA A1518/A1519 N6-dimethyltransferase RsmA/KsgA/DIM1 with predicted DNA glycosylase/AP lyase activity
MSNFGGWAIDKSTYKWILDNIDFGSNILELGSGTGTIELAKYYNVYSIEHNEDFLNLSKKSTYIYVEILNDFYNIPKTKDKLPKKYSLLLIDGPPKTVSNRNKFLEYIEYFNLECKILIDDTNRDNELKLLKDISKIVNRPYRIIGSEDKSFGII